MSKHVIGTFASQSQTSTEYLQFASANTILGLLPPNSKPTRNTYDLHEQTQYWDFCLPIPNQRGILTVCISKHNIGFFASQFQTNTEYLQFASANTILGLLPPNSKPTRNTYNLHQQTQYWDFCLPIPNQQGKLTICISKHNIGTFASQFLTNTEYLQFASANTILGLLPPNSKPTRILTICLSKHNIGTFASQFQTNTEYLQSASANTILGLLPPNSKPTRNTYNLHQQTQYWDFCLPIPNQQGILTICISKHNIRTFASQFQTNTEYLQSASANTILGLLPPNSKPTRNTCNLHQQTRYWDFCLPIPNQHQSASANTILGLLPPNSKPTRNTYNLHQQTRYWDFCLAIPNQQGILTICISKHDIGTFASQFQTNTEYLQFASANTILGLLPPNSKPTRNTYNLHQLTRYWDFCLPIPNQHA